MGSKTTTNSTQTMTPNNPQWVEDPMKGLTGLVGKYSQQDPTSFFAGPTGLTQQQFNTGGALGAGGADWLSQAVQSTQAAGAGYNPAQMQAAQTDPTAQATATRANGMIGDYLNPYVQNVAGSTLSDMARGLQMAQNVSGRGAIAAGQGYGGSRQGVIDANLNRDFFDRAGSTLGALYAQGFNTALGAADADANRLTTTSQFNAGQANSMAGLNAQLQQQANASNQAAQNSAWQFNVGNLQNTAGLLGNLGQYGLGYMNDAAATQQGLAQQQSGAPLSVLEALSGSMGSLPLGLFQGQTTTGKLTQSTGGLGSVLGSIGGLALGLGSLGSGIGALGGLGALTGKKG